MQGLSAILAAAALVALVAGPSLADQPATKGNGLPRVNMSDSWSLVIHARPFGKCPTSGFDGTNRRSLVVESLAGFDGSVNPHANKLPDASDFNDIGLVPNNSLDDFHVIDGNACDDDPAEVSLPIAVAERYDLYIKLIGKPDEATAASLCADLALDETEDFVCNIGQVRVRSHGKDPYTDVTDELLFLDAGDLGIVPVFDPQLEDWFWDWSATDKAKSRIVFVPNGN
jgi:hypothetical protein